MSRPKPPAKRCAIYTRKSSEEGLEQDFNSLQAQREAREAFIKNRRSEGWVVVDDAHDDGGMSGGSMERPVLKRPLDDIRARRIDTVVVHKIGWSRSSTRRASPSSPLPNSSTPPPRWDG